MSLLTVALPRSPRTTLAAASLACLVEPARAESGRSRKRSAVEVAEEELLKVKVASAKLEKEIEVLLRKGPITQTRENLKLQNKKAKVTMPNGICIIGKFCCNGITKNKF